MVMKVIVASNNQHKLSEMRAILGSKLELVSMSEFGIDMDIEENGKTLEENSLIKANAVANITNLPTLADDTGLLVDALDGAPGVYSARYAGIEHNDKKNREKLLKELSNVEYSKRTAHFETILTLIFPDGQVITAKGAVYGHILENEVGDNGFGYDPLFFSDELGKSFAEATGEEKNSISHRGRALQDLLQKLK